MVPGMLNALLSVLGSPKGKAFVSWGGAVADNQAHLLALAAVGAPPRIDGPASDHRRRANLAKAKLRPGLAPPSGRGRESLGLDIPFYGLEVRPAAGAGIVAGGPEMVAPEFLADLGEVLLSQ